MRKSLTFLLTLALTLTVTLTPPLTHALPQGRPNTPSGSELPSGKIVDSYRRGTPGARPAWVDDALTRSLAHLRSQGAAHGLADPDAELSLFSAIRDDLGQTHVRLEQVNRGVPIFGAQL